MMKLKPQYIFWILSVLFVLFGIINPNSTIDLQFHDTYLVVAYTHISILFATIFLIIGTVYFLLEKGKWKLVKFFTRFHVWVTLFSIIICSAIFIFLSIVGVAGMPRRYYRFDGFSQGEFDILSNVYNMATVLMAIFLIAQFSFILNLIASIFKNKGFNFGK